MPWIHKNCGGKIKAEIISHTADIDRHGYAILDDIGDSITYECEDCSKCWDEDCFVFNGDAEWEEDDNVDAQ